MKIMKLYVFHILWIISHPFLKVFYIVSLCLLIKSLLLFKRKKMLILFMITEIKSKELDVWMPCACVLHLNRTREWWNEPFHITVVKEFYKWIKLSSSPFALFQFFLFFSFFFMSAMTENKFVTAVYKGNFMLKEWGNNKCLHSKLKFFRNYFAIKKFFVDFSSKKNCLKISKHVF